MLFFSTSIPTISLLTLSIILCCLLVISSSNAVTSVLYLIFAFIFVALYLCSLNLQYIGITYVIIYVGAIIVLLLFVIMMINLNHYGDFNSNSPSNYNKTSQRGVASIKSSFLPTLPLIIISAIVFGYIMVKGTGVMEITSAEPQSKSFFQLVNQLIFSGSNIGDLSSLSPSNYSSYFTNLPLSSFYLSGPSSQIQSIALELYTHQAIWLIIISLVLIMSIIGPIVICKIR